MRREIADVVVLVVLVLFALDESIDVTDGVSMTRTLVVVVLARESTDNVDDVDLRGCNAFSYRALAVGGTTFSGRLGHSDLT